MSAVGKGSRYAHLDILGELGTRLWVSLIIQMRVLTVGGVVVVVVVDMVLEVSVESGGLAMGELLWRKLFMAFKAIVWSTWELVVNHWGTICDWHVVEKVLVDG